MINASRTPWWQPLALLACVFGVLAMPQAVFAGGIYDQEPVTEAELSTFINDLPGFITWARANKEEAHPVLNEQGRPDFVYSKNAAATVKSMGWDPRRFFCVMGRTAAALALEGKTVRDRPVDMPMVTMGELRLVRRYQEKLLSIGK